MSNDTRTLLREILSGKLTANQVIARLSTRFRDDQIVMAIRRPDGLYDLGEQTGLTESEMQEATQGAGVVLVVGYHQPELIETVCRLNNG